MRVGDSRPLIVWASAPLRVEIECFRSPPTPPVLRPCSECGAFPVTSGEAIEVRAPESAQAGYLQIVVTDAEGDSRTYRVHVSDQGETHGRRTATALA